MNRSFPHALAAATAALLPLATPALVCAGELDVSANTPAVTVSTRPANRNFIRVPDLEYVFVIDADCATGQQPGSISISIADTRVSLEEAETTASMPLSVPVTVPASQIGPIPLGRFCTSGDEMESAQAETMVTVPAVLSAQVSLLCTGESASEMSFTSKPLDVTLHCEPATEAGADTPIE